MPGMRIRNQNGENCVDDETNVIPPGVRTGQRSFICTMEKPKITRGTIMATAKPPINQILKMMFTDPVTIAGIVLPFVVTYLIVGSMPRNYPSINQIYIYGLILVIFSVYAQFRISSMRIRVRTRTDELEKMVRELNNLVRKTKDPVTFKREQEKGEFQ